MRKYANVDFSVCDPSKHDPEEGTCIAATACTHHLLEQEEPFDGPMLFSTAMCVGCGHCVAACPRHAITIESGM